MAPHFKLKAELLRWQAGLGWRGRGLCLARRGAILAQNRDQAEKPQGEQHRGERAGGRWGGPGSFWYYAGEKWRARLRERERERRK